ncbi:hypothetical protein WJX73_008304 [Symbiochloris irregularis]|uniref:Uncharacterized protein n=1 Tax=Symbiochloris irregularis TaxID=706552 RepID=A0AAW1PVC3_9CHLO
MQSGATRSKQAPTAGREAPTTTHLSLEDKFEAFTKNVSPKLKDRLDLNQFWEPQDFPAAIPGGYDQRLSQEQYMRFQHTLIGTPVFKCNVSKEQLSAWGMKSWKEYQLNRLLANWS